MKHREMTAQGRLGPGARAVLAVIAAAVIAAGVVLYNRDSDLGGPLPVHLPTTPQSYLGVYSDQFPTSYTALTAFSRATGTAPDIAMYYSGWFVPFPMRFANTAASNGVVPLVQMDPDGISVAAIASGQYDAYLSSFAESVREYRDPVIISFGHEMNGSWYSWGYKHTQPVVFVAAWRHIVRLFHALGARNVTWMWTVNIIDDTRDGTIPRPEAWWPGAGYVNWVGIDGYYLKPSWRFAPLFGPTIGAVRELTDDPILIAETGAVVAAGQPAKIADLFSGVISYGLLGFVYFDSANNQHQQFALANSAALAAFRKGARSYARPAS
jgi:mannan endo-1,4-beta-mannosidase